MTQPRSISVLIGSGLVTDCLFCRMVAGEIPADVVHETDRTLAFRDINPQAPTHVLVIPKDHHADLASLAAADPELLAEVGRECGEVARQEGVADDGYRVVFNTGREAGQSVFHVHGHVLGGTRLGWSPA